MSLETADTSPDDSLPPWLASESTLDTFLLSSGYHETLTRFWIGVVAASLAAAPAGCTRLDAVRHTYRGFVRRSALHREWYSFDVIKSSDARRAWVAPDGEPVGSAATLIFGG